MRVLSASSPIDRIAHYLFKDLLIQFLGMSQVQCRSLGVPPCLAGGRVRLPPAPDFHSLKFVVKGI